MRHGPIALACAVLFVGLAALMLLSAEGPILFDAPWLLANESWRTPGGIEAIQLASDLSGHVLMIPLCTVLAIVFALKDRRAGAFFALAVGGSALFNESIKLFFARPRPSIVERVYEPHGLSFPSGHSQASMAFALAVFFVVRRVWPSQRRWAALLFLFPLFIGWTRTYLGVHYPSDVMAGFLLAAVWVVSMDAWAVRVQPTAPEPSAPKP